MAQRLPRLPGARRDPLAARYAPRVPVTFIPAADLPYAELAPLFERGFEGYVVPIHTTPRAMEARNRLETVDLFASQIALAGAEPVALGLIARRGRRSRLAAMGVIPAARGTGVAQALLGQLIEDARDRGDDELVLECIASNERALRLYRRAGFVPTRRLVGWRAGKLAPEPQPLVEIDPATPGRAIARCEHGPLPWQVAAETLAAMTAPARAWTIDGSAYVVAIAGLNEVTIRGLFTWPDRRREGHAARLVRGLAAAFAPLPLAMPPIVPDGLGRELAEHLGLAPHELAQLEMALALPPGEPTAA